MWWTLQYQFFFNTCIACLPISTLGRYEMVMSPQVLPGAHERREAARTEDHQTTKH